MNFTDSTMKHIFAFLSLAVLTTLSATADELLFVNADFEKGTLVNWIAAGDAFKVQPTKGDNPAARDREPDRKSVV